MTGLVSGTATVPPGARAYAFIDTDGSVSHSKGITAANVTLAGNSLVCIEGLGFVPQSLIAVPAISSDDTTHHVAIGFGPNSNLGCPSGTNQVIIATHTDSGGDTRFPVIVQIS